MPADDRGAPRRPGSPGVWIPIERHARSPNASSPSLVQPPAVLAAGSESAKLAELRREVVQLQRQVRPQGDQMVGAAAAPIAQGEVQLAAEVRDPQAELERREEDEGRRLAYMVGVATAFRNEATDPTWAAATSSAVQAAIAEAGDFRQLAKSVECRSSTCRVEFTDDASGKLASILPMSLCGSARSSQARTLVASRMRTAQRQWCSICRATAMLW